MVIDKILDIVLQVLFFFHIKRKGKRVKGPVDEKE